MSYRVAVIGNWHLAHVTAACLAHAGNKTILVNHDKSVTWKEYPQCPVHEPGMPEMVAEARKKGLLDFENGVSGKWKADIIWMAVDTPVDDEDRPDLMPLDQIASEVNRQQSPQVFVISSQVPISYCGKTEDKCQFPVAYVPENLRLGKGIETFFKADRTVIGARLPRTAETVKSLMNKFETEFLLCNLETSEMVKHANNIFLATSISFANEVARVGEAFGVDGAVVAQALKLDKRIGKAAYVAPGLGFAGGTLPRDLRVLQQIGKQKQIPTPLVDAVLNVNENTSTALCDIVTSSASNKSIVLMGYTYKADTDTLRRSISIDLAKELKHRGFQVLGFDPFMNGKDISQIAPYLTHHNDVSEIPGSPSVVVMMTGRKQFTDLQWTKLAQKWDKALVLDAVGFLDAKTITSAGLNYKRLWSPQISS